MDMSEWVWFLPDDVVGTMKRMNPQEIANILLSKEM